MSERVYIAQNISCSLDQIFHCFSTDGQFEYEPVLDEFGPLNLSRVTRFIQLLNRQIAKHPNHKIVYYSGTGMKNLTTAIFLLGAYMMIKHNETALSVKKSFEWIDEALIEPFHAASIDGSKGHEPLSLVDCWGALEQAKLLEWLRLPLSAEDGVWGKIDPDEYEHYHNPLNADLHQIVPGQLLVLTAPVNLEGRDYADDASGVRRFSPSYLLSIFDELGVSGVASLGPPAYDPREFTAVGVAFAALETRSLSTALDQLLAADDAAAGAVAVHAGRGGSETMATALAALFLVRRFGFTPRAAAAWVRICRPGPSAAAALPAVLRRSSSLLDEQYESPTGRPPAGSPRKGSSALPAAAGAVPVVARAVLVAARAAPPACGAGTVRATAVLVGRRGREDGGRTPRHGSEQM